MSPRRSALAAACAALAWASFLVLAPTPVRGAERGVELRSLDVTGHPDISLEVSGPALAGTDLSSSDFELSENRRVVAASVDRLLDRSLDLVVVVDTSGSMAGAPIDGARRAASDFVAALPASARVGIVGFGATPTLLHPLSTARPDQLAALAGLTAAGETALHDALVLAGDHLASSTASRRAVVLLSDGGDTVSLAGFDQALDTVKRVDATVSVVELTTGETDHDALVQLAGSTGGTLVGAADAPALVDAFDTLRADLDGRYVIRYRSQSSGATPLALRITTPTGTRLAGAVLELPGAAAPAAPPVEPPPSRELAEPGFWASSFVRPAGVAALGIAMAIAVGVLLLPGKRSSRLARGDAARARRSSGPGLSDLTARASAAADRALDRHDRRTALERLLEQGGVAMRGGELAVLVAAATMVMALLALLAGGILLALFLAPLPLLLVRVALTRRRRHRQAAFADQLESVVQFLAGSLRAGYAVLQALESASQELASPAADELRRVTTEVRLGRDLGDALDSMGARVGGQDFAWVVQAIRINREVGGDLAEILDRVAETVRSRNSVRRQVQTLSAEGRISAYVLLALPPGVAAMLTLVNRPYAADLVNNSLGLAMVGFAVAMVIVGAIWIRRLIQLDY